MNMKDDLEPIARLEQIMVQLRDPKQGCPWDREQNFDSVLPHTIEETYEVVDAILKQDWPNLKEELGDLLFQIVFYSQLAKEQGYFNLSDVISTLNEKLVRRHPHVFAASGSTSIKNEADVQAQWEAIKAQEKQAQPTQTLKSILDDIPSQLPALAKAKKIQKKCAKYGFDWTSLPPVVDKVKEELDEVLAELEQPPAEQKIEEELGDLLFSVVNLARHLGQDPERALAKANHKFVRRFQAVEAKAHSENRALDSYTLEQLDELWDQVKYSERTQNSG